MLYDTVGQALVFAWMMLAGVAAGTCALAAAAVRRMLRAGFWLSLAADLMLGAASAALFCAALLAGNWGEMRLFCVVGFAAGYGLFMLGVARPLASLAKRLEKRAGSIAEFVSKSRFMKVIFR